MTSFQFIQPNVKGQIAMKSQARFTKTSAGRHALEVRDGRLKVRERRVLIMIDGQRTLEEISARLPPTLDLGKIIQYLQDSGLIAAMNNVGVQFNNQAAKSPTVAPEHILHSNDTEQKLTDVQRQILEQELIEFIGPMASLICSEVWASQPSYDQALNSLAAEISNPTHQTRFRQNVTRRLG